MNFIFCNKKIYIYTSIIGILYVLLCNIDNDYNNLFYLPLSYLTVFIIENFNMTTINNNYLNNYEEGIALQIFRFLIFTRYVIMPIAIVYTKQYGGIGIDPDNRMLNFAIMLMTIELIMVVLTIDMAKRYYFNKNNKIINNKIFCNYQINVMPINPIVVLFVILITIIIMFFNIDMLVPNNVFNKEVVNGFLLPNSDDIGGIYLLHEILKVVIFLFVVTLIHKNKFLKIKNLQILMLSIISLIYVFSMLSTKRWNILFIGILCLYTIKEYSLKIPRYILLSIIFFMFFLIINISMYKFSWYLIDSSEPIQDILKYILGSFQAYFSGPRNVAQAIDMSLLFKLHITVRTFINDFLGSVPYFSQYVNQSDRINIYFNYYNNLIFPSQIIPMIGIGYSYFSLLAPIISMLCVWIIVKIDFAMQITRYLEYKFIYLYLALYLSMCMGFNTQIIFSFFISKFVPLYLLFSINRIVVWQIKNKGCV